ncbi:MAG: hypothetical protein KDK39_12475 [Leptospiraceae bacterium]|nr:hypothetical protein [Leptospiraceae bacterium]
MQSVPAQRRSFYKRPLVVLLSLGLLWVQSPLLYADSVRSYESGKESKATMEQIKSFLANFDSEMDVDDETEGFRLRLNSGFWSPFHYDLFVGPVSRTNPDGVVRLEGDTGDVRTMARVFEIETILKAGSTQPADERLEAVKLDEKSHLISQGLNLVAPWLGVLYSSYDSPRLSTGQTVFRFSAYLLFDGLMVWAGGTGFWQEPFNTKKYDGTIVAALMLPRIIGAWQQANLVRGHNQVARLGYTFYLDDY